MIKENLSARLRDVRDYYKLNQTDFGAEIRLSPFSIRKLNWVR
jgi:hypothetical protein